MFIKLYMHITKAQSELILLLVYDVLQPWPLWVWHQCVTWCSLHVVKIVTRRAQQLGWLMSHYVISVRPGAYSRGGERMPSLQKTQQTVLYMGSRMFETVCDVWKHWRM